MRLMCAVAAPLSCRRSCAASRRGNSSKLPRDGGDAPAGLGKRKSTCKGAMFSNIAMGVDALAHIRSGSAAMSILCVTEDTWQSFWAAAASTLITNSSASDALTSTQTLVQYLLVIILTWGWCGKPRLGPVEESVVTKRCIQERGIARAVRRGCAIGIC